MKFESLPAPVQSLVNQQPMSKYLRAYDAAETTTEAQAAALAKALTLGWTVSKMLMNPVTGLVAYGLKSKEIGGFLMPSGELVRPKNGCKTAHIRFEDVA